MIVFQDHRFRHNRKAMVHRPTAQDPRRHVRRNDDARKSSHHLRRCRKDLCHQPGAHASQRHHADLARRERCQAVPQPERELLRRNTGAGSVFARRFQRSLIDITADGGWHLTTLDERDRQIRMVAADICDLRALRHQLRHRFQSF